VLWVVGSPVAWSSQIWGDGYDALLQISIRISDRLDRQRLMDSCLLPPSALSRVHFVALSLKLLEHLCAKTMSNCLWTMRPATLSGTTINRRLMSSSSTSTSKVAGETEVVEKNVLVRARSSRVMVAYLVGHSLWNETTSQSKTDSDHGEEEIVVATVLFSSSKSNTIVVRNPAAGTTTSSWMDSSVRQPGRYTEKSSPRSTTTNRTAARRRLFAKQYYQ
jgi:hypothetical protein